MLAFVKFVQKRKISEVLLLHDNIRTHTSVHTTLTITKFQLRVLQLPT